MGSSGARITRIDVYPRRSGHVGRRHSPNGGEDSHLDRWERSKVTGNRSKSSSGKCGCLSENEKGLAAMAKNTNWEPKKARDLSGG